VFNQLRRHQIQVLIRDFNKIVNQKKTFELIMGNCNLHETVNPRQVVKMAF
jgi:hypothetical protein